MAARKPREKEKIKDYALKHSAAHLMASAVLEIYPKAHLAIGPPTEEGFYYDIGGIHIKDEDLGKIEQKMREIAKKNLRFEKQEKSSAEAKKILKNQPYKQEILGDIKGKIIFYKHGDFIDLCEGPHVRYTKELKHVKLMKVSGAYWRGDDNNPMLTRIYGVIFKTKEELDTYLKLLEEAKKRDHKKLGKELDLFTFSSLVGPGLPLWTPKGMLLRDLLDDFVWQLRKEKGYQKVGIPYLTKKELYETSGHWKKFQDELFKITTREGHQFAMKPMNCPHHIQIFARHPYSYRDLPQRYCETTAMYRDEQSGELSGLSRVRGITCDDAHVFCRKDQVEQEIENVWDIINKFYKVFGFKLTIRFSRHNPDKFEECIGTKEGWETAEKQILKVIKKHKVNYIDGLGEAAFYGPKIDFITKDSLGREWQVATIQLDLNQPERFNLNYATEENKLEQVVMIHAAIMGSHERFISNLIEETAGNFPLWLAPEQVRILPMNDKCISHAKKIKQQMKQEDIRVGIDERGESISKKVRDGQLAKIPFLITIGKKEIQKKTLAVRNHEGKVEFGVKQNSFINTIKKKIASKAR